MAVFFLMWGLLFFIGGCTSASRPSTPSQAVSTFPQKNDATLVSLQINGDSTATPEIRQRPTDAERLAQLWQARTSEASFSDYPIGPGDVLEISVPAMEELQSRAVRVSGEGTISLPLIGIIQAGGFTEKEISEEIRRRLEEHYMYNPQVQLFVREYRSRQAAVLGAVEKPGLYSLASESDTLLDLLALAGGMTEQAAPLIHFIPAEPVGSEQAKRVVSALPVQLNSRDPSLLILKRTDPIVIELKNLTRGGNQTYLALPIRPGDVIMVPGSGEVLVDGWVTRPGSYKITSGLTVIGAVAAAGGPLFAADTSSIKVIRAGKEGEKTFLFADLKKIKVGESPDMPLQDGDIVDVPYAAAMIVPYGFYSLIRNVVPVGASVPIY